LARELEQRLAAPPVPAAAVALDAPQPVVWSLALDEIHDTGVELRPRLPLDAPDDFTGPTTFALRAAAAPLSSVLAPMAPDPLTVADDPHYLERIAAQPNVPEAVRNGLAQLY
jgi:hypothetical protein